MGFEVTCAKEKHTAENFAPLLDLFFISLFGFLVSKTSKKWVFLLVIFCSKMALKFRPKMGYFLEPLAKMPRFQGLALAGAPDLSDGSEPTLLIKSSWYNKKSLKYKFKF